MGRTKRSSNYKLKTVVQQAPEASESGELTRSCVAGSKFESYNL